jgi:hypothetical protein
MSLKNLPKLFEPWSDADMERLTLDEALYLQMIFEKKKLVIEDRIERFAEFLVEDRQKYQKIFNFNK